MLVELIQIKQDSRGNYSLCTVYVNPDQIVFLSENVGLKFKLREGKLKLGLNQNFTNFTDIRLNFNNHASEITVIGDPGLVESKIIIKKQKQLLKG